MTSDRHQELLEAMFSAAPDAVIVVDQAGRVELASPAIEVLFGYQPDEIIGQAVEVLLPEALREVHVHHRQAYGRQSVPRPMGAGLKLQGRRKDGTVFPIDVSLAPARIDDDLVVGAYVRDATDRRRGEDLLRYVNDISHQVLAGHPTAGLLTLICQRARALIDAAVVWLAVPAAESPDCLVVAAADGKDASVLLGARVPVRTSLAARAMEKTAPVVVEDMRSDPLVLTEARSIGLGPGVYLPMLAEDGPIGSLVVARRPGSSPFSGAEIAVVEGFTSAAAVVVALGRAGESLEQLRMVSEHERIARDLHDTVIQRLFALGMGLQAAERLAGTSDFSERIRAAVSTIDEVIREIRETIFDLNNPHTTIQEVRHRVREVAGECVDQLGFSPRISFRGPVEAAVTAELTLHLLSVLREALSNVGRHAKAASADVVLAAVDGWVTLSVADDGIGPSEEPTAGNGLANMRSRAQQLGGDVTFSRRNPSGTLLQWRVPTGRSY